MQKTIQNSKYQIDVKKHLLVTFQHFWDLNNLNIYRGSLNGFKIMTAKVKIIYWKN